MPAVYLETCLEDVDVHCAELFFFFFLISIPLQSHRETSIAGVALKMSSSMTGFSSFSWMLVSGIDGELPPLPTHTNLLFIALFHFLFAPQPPPPQHTTPLPTHIQAFAFHLQGYPLLLSM